MKRTAWKRIGALLLTAALGLTLPVSAEMLPEDGAISGEAYSIFDSELIEIELSAGFRHEEKLSSTGGAYNVTLGPDEEGFSFMVTPAEDGAPTLEVFLDGSDTAYDTPDPGAPSRFIPVGLGETKTVLLRSTAGKPSQDGTVKTNEFTWTVHRTATQFQWQLGSSYSAEDGGTVQPVTLAAPAGLEIKTLQFALGFDPAKLQLCDVNGHSSAELYDFLPAVEGFHHTSRPESGYFKELNWISDNTQGYLEVQFGAATNSLNNTAFRVEEGKEQLLTIYFKVLDPDFEPDTLYIRQDYVGKDGKFSLRSGISVVEKFGGSFLASQSPEMVKITGLPEPIVTHTVRLPTGSYPGGTLTASPDKEVFSDGETLTLTAQPAEGYAFAGWDAGSTGLSGGAVLSIAVDRDMDLTSLAPLFDKKAALPPNEKVDSEAPFTGDILLTVSGTSAKAKSASVEKVPFAERDVDRNGLTVLDFYDSSEGEDSAAANMLALELNYRVGDRAVFKTRDTRVTQSTAGHPAWPEKEFELKAVGTGVNIWFAVDNEVKVGEAQFQELAESFDRSLTWLNENCGEVYDRNGNQKLDVLLYDIQDVYTDTNGASGSYIAGLTSYAELYGGQGRGSVGNNADAVHLDTWPAMSNKEHPDLSTPISTFAHEAQHLASFSTDAAWKATQKNAVIQAANPPDWINEGLSMAAEHALFGVRSSRIYTFNTSEEIKNGYSLTNWGKKLEDYALSYLFTEYLLTQAEAVGQTGFLKTFYTDYSAGAEQTVLKLAQALPQFAEMSFDDLTAAFYAALYLQEDSGVYGFAGNDAFRSVRPQLAASTPNSLPAAAGVYTALKGSYTPVPGSGYLHLGLTAPEIMLAATADRGGSVTREPGKASYNRNECVTVKAVPDEGYLFTGWTGDVPAGQAEDPIVTLCMDRSKTVHASFAVDSSSQEPPPVPEPIVPDEILGGTASVSEDKKTAEYADRDGNRSLLSAADVTKMTDGTAITLTAVPTEGKRFLYWEVGTEPAGAESFSVEGDSTQIAANPLETKARTGVSYTAVFGEVLADVGSTLSVLEPHMPDGRRLVSMDGEKKSRFGLQPGIYDYALYLRPEEMQAQMTLSTNWLEAPLDNSKLVSGISVTGADSAVISLEPQPGESETARNWTEPDGAPLTLTLAEEKDSGTVTITLTNAGGAEQRYTITLIRVSADPAVTITGENGVVVAKVDNAQMRALSISLKVPKAAFEEPGEVKRDSLSELPPGLEYVHAAVSAIEGDTDHWLFNIAVDTGESGAVYAQPFTIALFKGFLDEVSVYDDAGDNVINDVRFGTVYNAIHKEGQVTLSGTVTGYDASVLPEITLEDEAGAVIYGQVEVVDGAQYGLRTFSFRAPLALGKTYTMTVTKKNHTDWIITDILLSMNTQLKSPLALYAGDLDEDKRVTVFDADMLAAGLGKPDCDLDGDGMATVFDLDILTSPENLGGGKRTMTWSDAEKGSAK